MVQNVLTEITYMASPRFSTASAKRKTRLAPRFIFFLAQMLSPLALRGQMQIQGRAPRPRDPTGLFKCQGYQHYCPPHLGNTISTLRVRGSTMATSSSTTT
jgi:hypothetical protein